MPDSIQPKEPKPKPKRMTSAGGAAMMGAYAGATVGKPNYDPDAPKRRSFPSKPAPKRKAESISMAKAAADRLRRGSM
jgi:hypothetical protein